MTTPDELGLDTPGLNDLIREGAGNITTNAGVLAQVWDGRHEPQYMTTTYKPHLDTLRAPNVYAVPTADIGAAVGMPNGRAGTVVVEDSGNSTGLVTQRVWEFEGLGPAAGGTLWWRGSSSFADTWGPWKRITDGHTMTADASTQVPLAGLRKPGIYGIANHAVAATVGMPNERAGTVIVADSGNANDLTFQMAWEYPGPGSPAGGTLSWRGSNSFTGVYGPWREIGGSGESSSASTGHGHTVRLSDATRRRGGPIGTGGRGVVALRFDHGLANFRDIILPELRRLGLPWTQALNSDRWAIPENGGVTPAQVQTWAHETGGEVWNHGRTHGDASALPELITEIVTSLDELTDQFPALHVEGWIVPGVGGTGYGGFGSGSTPAEWDTTAGRLILEHHAFATGHQAGILRALYGEPQVGAAHWGIDSASSAAITIGHIDDAAAHGYGLTVMAHPSLIDQAGQYTTATLVQILEHIAAERDAGRLVVLPMSGLELADSQSRHVHNPIPPMTLPNGSPVAAGASLSREQSASGVQQFRGIPRVAEVDIDMSSAGTVALAVDGCGTHTITVPAGRQTVRRWVTVPADQNLMKVTVTPSVAATVHQVALPTGPTPAPS